MSIELSNDTGLLYEVYGSDLQGANRLLYPIEKDVDEVVLSSFQQLKRRGGAVGLVDGAFDVPHPIHEWYLRHCKLLGAAACLNTVDASAIRRALRGGGVSLAVTVDADAKIAQKKSGKAEKGGVDRPIYPWVARAGRVAGYAYAVDNEVRYVADMVTVEGDPAHKGTLLESSLRLAKGLREEGLLDYFVVYGEHGDTVDEARDMGLKPIVIGDDVIYERNPQTGGPWKSSAIISRAQGGSAPHPITRPRAGEYE